jgi:Terminase large subunit, T4likevirus-type, N-terminal
VKLYGKLKAASPGNEGFRLPNGSEIVALPESEARVRGFSNPRMIVVDEAAFVKDQTYNELLPSQAVGNGAVLLLSTPNGQTGFFYEKWHEREKNWTKIKVPVSECSLINTEWLKQQKRDIGEDQYKQEFECEFLHNPECMMTRELWESALREDIKPLFEWTEDGELKCA